MHDVVKAWPLCRIQNIFTVFSKGSAPAIMRAIARRALKSKSDRRGNAEVTEASRSYLTVRDEKSAMKGVNSVVCRCWIVAISNVSQPDYIPVEKLEKAMQYDICKRLIVTLSCAGKFECFYSVYTACYCLNSVQVLM